MVINYFFWFFFIIINSIIIYFDLCFKKIPNILLLIILIMAIFFQIYNWKSILNLNIHIYIILFLIFFIIYKNFRIWWWDLKYILVLLFIIWYGKLFILLWNIWLLIILFFLYEFIYDKKRKNIFFINKDNFKKNIRRNTIFFFKRTIFFLSFFLSSFIISKYTTECLFEKSIKFLNSEQEIIMYYFLAYIIIFKITFFLLKYLIIDLLKLNLKLGFYFFICFLIFLIKFIDLSLQDLFLIKWSIFVMFLLNLLVKNIYTNKFNLNHNTLILKESNELKIIYKTFPLWIFLFSWFIITYFFDSTFLFFIKYIIYK